MTDRFAGIKFLVFLVVCVGISFVIAAVIGNWRFGPTNEYSAEFGTVQGLLVNDAVKISGVTVGKVNGITVTPQGTAMVDFEVDEEYEITEDSTVMVRWRDVFGLRFLYVDPGDGPVADSGTTFPREQTVASADLTVLLDRIVPTLNALDPEFQNIVLEALAEGLVGRDDEVDRIIADGAALTEAIASRDAEIESLIDDSTTIVQAYSERRDDLQALIGSFADVAESVASRNDLLVSSIVQVADAQAELDRLLEANDTELRAALDEAEVIVRQIADRPGEFEDVLETSGEGLVAYHRISRWGQWFNISVVGSSVDEQTVTTRNGAQLPDHQDGSQTADADPSPMGSFFAVEADDAA
jgi:phospholipid/cholesterol/gamma-HCH transport system substrate-binding protein